MTEVIVADVLITGVLIADVLNADVLNVYHGGYGHTARQAAAVHEGAAPLPCVRAQKVQVADVDADLNRLGSYLGAAAQSNVDEGPDLAPPRGDLDTAHRHRQRIAEIALRLCGASLPDLVAAGHEISLTREIPSRAERTSS